MTLNEETQTNGESGTEARSVATTTARRSPSPEPPSSTSLLDNSSSIEQEKPPPPRQTSPQSRTLVPAYLVAGYSALSIFAWVTTCILAYRPLWTSKYMKQYLNDYQDDLFPWSPADIIAITEKNESWYQSIRVLQAVVAVSTLPLTTTILSAAAVIFVQRTTKEISLRQLIVLADKGWSDVMVMLKTPYMKYGSPFLKLAVVLYVLGGVISPLQQYFLATKPIKVSLYDESGQYVTDIPNQFNWRDPTLNDNDLVVLVTRGLLETTASDQPHAQIWRGAGYECPDTKDWLVDDLPLQPCRAGTTMDEMTRLANPFLAQLPAGYSTGLIRQFIPRINSSAEVTTIAAEDFPKSCGTMPGAFWADYATRDEYDYFSGLQVCMPGNLTISPWKRTRDVQSFTEHLYINTTYEAFDTKSYLKVTLNTTAGYFELPNYWNQTAGELLEKDPFGSEGACQKGCARRFRDNPYDGETNDTYPYPLGSARRIRLGLDPWDPNALEGVINKGPLLTIAMALFGRNSYLQGRLDNPSAYGDLGRNETANPGGCAYLSPTNLLYLDPITAHGASSDMGQAYCTSNTMAGQDGKNVREQVVRWIVSLFGEHANLDRLGTLFRGAALLANLAWLQYQTTVMRHALGVHRDLGFDTVIPSVSLVGIVTISTLLAMHLIALSLLAAYAARKSDVVDTKLDAWAMMKFGATYADCLSAKQGEKADDVKELDHLPGRIRNGQITGDG